MTLSLRSLLPLALVFAMPFPELAAAGGSLADRIRQHEGWSAYSVAMTEADGVPCCFAFDAARGRGAGCDLDGRNSSWGTTNSIDAPAPTDRLTVYVHAQGGRIDQVRAYGATCPVRAKATPAALADVTDADSLDFLDAQYRQGGRKDADDMLLAAIAYHRAEAATTRLAELAKPVEPRESREKALFWLGQLRGLPGVERVDHYASLDPSPELREHALFVLSQAKVGDGYARIRRIAGSDADAEVRSRALFWMAQTGDRRAKDDILAAIRREHSTDGVEQAVFALSQLREGEGDEALIALLSGDYPRAAKEKALFWLGQSGSEKALAYFDTHL